MTGEISGSIVLGPLQCSGTILHEYEVLLRKAEEELNEQKYSLSIIMSHAAIEKNRTVSAEHVRAASTEII